MGSSLQAAVFDLDGVITRTARTHFAAWRRLFEPLTGAFTEDDYRRFVDGRPRIDGLRAWLSHRNVQVPEGGPEDTWREDTIHGLMLRKNRFFHEALQTVGVDVFPGAVRLVGELRALGVRVGVASSSRNCGAILERAGLGDLFEAQVDGVLSAELGLKGKPAPDIFLECLRRLDVREPARAAMFEDAIAGVRAGRAGGFGLVVGVDRTGDAARLYEAGADLVTEHLGALSPDLLEDRLAAGAPAPIG